MDLVYYWQGSSLIKVASLFPTTVEMMDVQGWKL